MIQLFKPATFDNKNLLQELKAEVPAFIQYLVERPFTTQCTSRMWFRPDKIQTASLKRVIRYNRNRLEVEMAQLLLLILDIKEHLEEICFTLSDVHDWLIKRGFKGYDTGSIRRTLQNVWNLKPTDNSFAYLQYRFGTDGGIYEYNQKGRFYLVTKKRDPDA